jgi:hypothetical protein
MIAGFHFDKPDGVVRYVTELGSGMSIRALADL